MNLKIPPAFQFLICILIMYGITKVNGTHFVFEFQNYFVWILFLIGIIIGLIAVFSFYKAKTSVDPLHPTKASKLISGGIYKYTRNPMYLGMLLVLVAAFVKFGNYINITVLVAYVWYITNFQIKPEEKTLTEIFGKDFTDYCKKVRRWI
ncbi:methyltransferase family protein [Aureibaculum conchae]|uniref:methyltransferase family protein n=1 Tax=Aureibaculum sp. 2308TA14-22 TaxID=3108392 RepID=UPI0033972F84